jgi:putative tryptophan/tyrosine transport system substrate-binding protein
MTRREFVTLLGGAAAWPLAAGAQQPAMPVIGFLSGRAPGESAHLVEAYRRALKEDGFVEGQNLAIEFRWARGDYGRLPALAADLVSRHVAVISAVGGDPSPLAAKAASAAIPIIFNFGTDPVHAGLIASFNRPGGNATGISTAVNMMEPKRLGEEARVHHAARRRGGCLAARGACAAARANAAHRCAPARDLG